MSAQGDIFATLLGLGALYVFWRLVAPAIDRKRWRVALDLSMPGLMLALLSVVTFWALLSSLPIVVVPALVIAIAFHEYGHVLAYRLTGHRNPVFRLIPFGGVATSDQPIHSQAENAFISLMGPGFSIALALGLLLIASWLPDPVWRLNAVIAAGGVAALNLLNMAPFYPLDGGRALKAMLTIFGEGIANGVLIGLNVLLGLYGLLMLSQGRGGAFFILIAVFGALAASAEAHLDRTIRRMTWVEAALTALVFAAIVAALFATALPALRHFAPGVRGDVAATAALTKSRSPDSRFLPSR